MHHIHTYIHTHIHTYIHTYTHTHLNQVSFHGFPGTMGADFMHYLVADKLTTPPEHSTYYTEKLIIVPHTYLTNDHRQSRREVYALDDTQDAPTRQEFGFSADDVILCSFNQLYKIEPDIFAAWMSILRKVPRAKIWILKFTDEGAAKLRESCRTQNSNVLCARSGDACACAKCQDA
jgi:protein O-GlcNAc transferase